MYEIQYSRKCGKSQEIVSFFTHAYISVFHSPRFANYLFSRTFACLRHFFRLKLSCSFILIAASLHLLYDAVGSVELSLSNLKPPNKTFAAKGRFNRVLYPLKSNKVERIYIADNINRRRPHTDQGICKQFYNYPDRRPVKYFS